LFGRKVTGVAGAEVVVVMEEVAEVVAEAVTVDLVAYTGAESWLTSSGVLVAGFGAIATGVLEAVIAILVARLVSSTILRSSSDEDMGVESPSLPS